MNRDEAYAMGDLLELNGAHVVKYSIVDGWAWRVYAMCPVTGIPFHVDSVESCIDRLMAANQS